MNYNSMFNAIKGKLDITTDGELAEKLGISKSRLSKLRNGHENLSLSKFYDIVRSFDNDFSKEILEMFWRE